MPEKYFAHQTADVNPKSEIGENTKIWNLAQVRENTKIGSECIISKNVYIDIDVEIGNRVKIQNNSSIYKGTIIEDGVFVGPHVVFTNDKNPRAINPDGTLKSSSDWDVGETRVGYGASIGAHSVILPGIKIGKFSLIGAGSVVTRDVPDYGLVLGNPARLRGFVCKCAKVLEEGSQCETCRVSLVTSNIEEVV